ncbi:uncharacterized protein PODANS_1_1270 [Podospora anserina S mat+]|uniref:Podospora anserina S mat+ genomic DNA chromosome 1, supercontig 1 n=4 Tax=Podospora TaxID=5144 RepID=B2A9P7_PODAN|nr:uncharacterized protein PODANS_1_1270 [Podospora anserina S mat+]KAK4647412.1 hypothetical protein QC761_101270 [Podospora bellae-mahoneyi]KAK4658374.1 hypothetical protein QC762_101270 [Podospora pseudocomata]VBB71436.1 Putative protein of unknown function [Podospora comata]CAP59795.1 unnamed protein product [Podospora anserina S mat+]CDP22438.1 Putative protein of unknown function [Podospora anserina S mat+]
MALTTALALLASAQVATAHFGIEYPTWRDNTLGSASTSNYSQWEYPCAGVPGDLGNVTDWPLDGGSLVLDLHHEWTYIFVNLGLGENVANFNYSLTDPFLNSTGNGTLCIPKVTLPANLPIQDGSLASIQVVTLGEKGQSLYNCADIRFRQNATVLSGDACKTSEGVSAAAIEIGGTKTAGSTVVGVNVGVLASVAALTGLFVFGLSV